MCYAGLCTTLVPLGVAGSFAGRLFYGHRDVLVAVGGWTIIALGAAQIVGLGFAFRRVRDTAARIKPGSSGSVYVLGALYGLAGFCAGPVLGSVLTVSAMSGSPLYGGVLLAVYALGMALPMFVLAFFWDRFGLGRRRWLRGREFRIGRLELHTNSLVSGMFFIVLGALFLLFDGTSAMPAPLDVDAEFAAQRWVQDVAGRVSDGTVIAVVAGVTAAGVLVAQYVRGRRADAAPEREPGESPMRN